MRGGYGYGMAAGGRGRSDGIIWDLDFSPGGPVALTTSPETIAAAQAYLSARGASLTRPSAATVQTSASTVYTGIGVDQPRVGLYGLVIEEARTNSCDVCDPWTWGATFATKTHVAGPDGAVSAARVDDADAANTGFLSRSIPYAAATQYIHSMWALAEESTPAGSIFGGGTNDGGPGASLARAAYIGAWKRYVGATYVSGAGPSSNFSVVPAWGAAAHTGAVSFAFIQRENGKFATEAIITTGAAATRAADVLTVSRDLVRGGRLALEYRFVPKANAGSYSSNSVTLWINPGSGEYVGFHGVNRNVVFYVAGVAYSSPAGATSWSAGDVVDLFASCGGGVPAVFKYRVNGGAVQTLTIAAGASIPALAAAPSCRIADVGAASAWYQLIRAYAPGRRPGWAS